MSLWVLCSLTMHTCKGTGVSVHTCPHMFSVEAKEKALAIKYTCLLRTAWDLDQSLENVLTVLSMLALPSLPGRVLMRSTQPLPKDSLLRLREPRGQNDRIWLPSPISTTLHKGATSLQSPAVSADIVSIMGTLLYPMAFCAGSRECYLKGCAHTHPACSHQMPILGNGGKQQCCFVWLLW